MNYSTRVAAVLLLSFACSTSLFAQLSGSVTVPSTSYPDLGSVIAALNTQGVGTGGVTINVTAGNAQNAPVGGYQLGSTVLNASASAANPIVFHGNGNAINPYTGTGTTDGFFKILGTDYVTVDNFSFTESSSNVTPTTQMEWGVALLKLNSTLPYDGCKHVTVSNCTFTMGIMAVSSAFYTNNHTAANTTLLATTGATLTDLQSDNAFTGNTVNSGQYGVNINGISSATIYDRNYTISNNTISVGGNSTGAYGVYATNDSIITVTQNSFTSSPQQTATLAAIRLDNGSGNVTVSQNNISLLDTIASAGAGSMYGLFNINWSDKNATLTFSGNTMANWKLVGGPSSKAYGLYSPASNGLPFASINITGNTMRDFNVNAGFSGFYYVAGPANNVTMSNNVIKNIITTYAYASQAPYYIAGTGTGQMNVLNNTVVNLTSSISTLTNGMYVSSGQFYNLNVKNNKLDSFNLSGSGTFTGYYLLGSSSGGGGGMSSEVAYDTVSNITTTTGGIIGMYSALGTPGIHNNVFTGFTTGNASGSGLITGFTNADGMVKFYNNTITGLTVLGTATSSGSITGIQFTGIRDSALIYNNTIGGISLGSAYNNATAITGMQLVGGNNNTNVTYRIHHNTLNLAASSSGANLGAKGISYTSGVTALDLRNNIINVNVTPAGTGYTAIVNRTTGTAGTAAANLAPGNGGNIYYAPLAANAYIYAEGTAVATLVNAYNMSNDANFNTACSNYKNFLGNDYTSAVENNLTAGTLPRTYVPSGASLAKNAGTLSPFATDYSGVTRTTPADAGALQFTGTVIDSVGPAIAYTALSSVAYCTSAPVLPATITDASNVNTAAGNAPRMYYRKATESNIFGTYPANNTSSFNGWKYVAATGTLPNLNFTPDYSLLTAQVVQGDSIVYFIIAQDMAATPHVGSNKVSFSGGYCPANVNLSGAATTATVAYGYKITALPSFTAVASPATLCNGDNAMISLSPAPADLSVIWQQDNNTGTFSAISGATGSSYTTPALTASNNYKAVLQCNSTTVATTPAATVTVNLPQIVSTTPNQHCDPGAISLSATASAGATINWYTASTGGLPVATGTTFTTPVINASTTYYTTASNGTTVKSTGKSFSTGFDGSSSNPGGPIFNAMAPFVLQSVAVYPIGTGAGTATVTLQDGSGTVLQTTTVNLTGSAIPGVKTQIPLNFPVPVGNNYQLRFASKTGLITGFVYDYSVSAGINFPYTIPGIVSITGNSSANQYAYFYDWKVGVNCESSRTPVVATISNNGPAFAINGTQTVCNNAIATLAVSSPLTNYDTYTWTPATNLYADAAATVPYTAGTSATTVYAKTASSGATVYNVSAVSNTSGCAAVDSGKVWVQPGAATVTASPTRICMNGTSQISLVPNSGYAPNSIQWGQSADGITYTAITGANSTTYSASMSATTFFRALIKNSANGICIQPHDSVFVANPQIASATSGSHCGAGAITLSATGTGDSVLNWYSALTGGTLLGTGNTFTTPVISSGNTYYVSAQSFAGCESARTAVQASISAVPVVTVTPAPAVICAGDTVTLVASSANSGYSYYWNPTALANNENKVAPAVSTDYYLTAIDSSNGVNNGCIYHDTVTVTVNALPATPVVTLNGTVLSTGTTYASYQWYLNGQPVAGATASTWTAVTNGSYTVVVTNASGCHAVSAAKDVLGVGVNNVAIISKDIYIYPNSASNMIWIKAPVTVNLELYNAEGRRLAYVEKCASLDLSQYAGGVYLIRITDETGACAEN